MSVMEHMLRRTAAELASGAKSGQPSAASSLASASLEELFRGHPPTVMQVLLFRDQELLHRRTYDSRVNQVLPDDPSQLWAAVHGIRDLLQDTFTAQGPYLTYVVGRWRITALFEGAYTLVAATHMNADPGRVAAWLLDMALKLPPGAA
jgi:hypothetical protein